MSLTLKQARFVKEFLIDLNATQAAIRAGYSAKTAAAIGHENLKKTEVDRAITEAQRTIEEKLDISAERVVMELAKLAFSNMLDYTKVTEYGQLDTDLSNLTRDQAAAIAEVTSERVRILAVPSPALS